MYIQDGLQALLKPSLTRKPKPCVLNEAEHKAIEKKLKTPTNGINGYIELMAWVTEVFSINFVHYFYFSLTKNKIKLPTFCP